MWRLEDILKPELDARSVDVPTGREATSAQDVQAFAHGRDRVVLKALVPANDRAASGQVEIVEAGRAAATFERLHAGGARIWIEEHLDVVTELFVGIMWPGERPHPDLAVSLDGGTGVEARARAGTRVARLPLAPGWNEHLHDLAMEASLASDAAIDPDRLEQVVLALYDLFEAAAAISLEINPLALVDGGRLVALDAKAYCDPYAPPATAFDRTDARPPAHPDDVDLEFTELDARPGSVGVLSIGAGLTRAVMDWISARGRPVACFSDLIPAVLADTAELLAGRPGATVERATTWLCSWLASHQIDRLFVNLVSGGTPTDALTNAVLRGLAAAGWAGRVEGFAAGNQAEAARRLWAEAGHAAHESEADAIAAIAA